MIASNFKSRVVGVSLKDRAVILRAGHAADTAFWLEDSTGHFITSNYYMTGLPAWVDSFIPLIFMGWGIHPGKTNETVDMTDIAPTMAALLPVSDPIGCVSKPIRKVLEK